ncbi:MAG: lipoyl(octanoyl) transferase LipB [Gammaproteobacteria bacterium]|nr:lipoyl(octanoyl) transferase LipB [Gammaproteobacteria bacterium]
MQTPQIMQLRDFGSCDYAALAQAMQEFTAARTAETIDELWLVEHPPVYTLGVGAKAEHLLDVRDIAIVQSNRGGQVTYHGPGQLVVYVLFDLRRLHLGVRKFVIALEQIIIRLLSEYEIHAEGRRDAPGVYVDGRKIASLGLRVSNSCTYHGLSLNIDMDLNPFKYINPCGYPGLIVTQMAAESPQVVNFGVVKQRLVEILAQDLGYTASPATAAIAELRHG